MVSDEVLAALASRGLELQEDQQGERPLAVKGDTYRFKRQIKEAGGIWSRDEQCWRLRSTDDATRLGSLVASADGLAEAPGRFAEQPGQRPEGARGDSWGSKHYHGHRGRLRSRFLDTGPEALADYELLELILFFSVWRRDTKPLAKAMIERFGSLGAVLAAEPARYAEIIAPGGQGGEGERHGEDLRFTQVLLKAIRALHERTLKEEIKDRPVISSWTALIDYLTAVMTHDTSEHFRLLFLDRKNILIKDEVQSRGTVDHTPLYPREVVKRALELAASAIIMVHNHPSGDPTPSKADIEMTRQVIQALQSLNITVHDHVIIGKNRHTSFRSERLI